MVASTIREKFTEEELAFLLAFEANEADKVLTEKREDAYMAGDFALATKLERYTHHSQIRLNRRYNNLQIH